MVAVELLYLDTVLVVVVVVVVVLGRMLLMNPVL